MADSRRLLVLVRIPRGAVPVLVAATITPAACNAFDDPGSPYGFSDRPPEFGPGFDASVVGGAGGTIIFGPGGGFAAGGSGGIIDNAGVCYSVDVPGEGVPADPGQICAVSTDPVDSNTAARVTLTWSGDVFQTAAGVMTIDANMLARLIGDPKIDIVDATLPLLYDVQIEKMMRTATGYSFIAQWPSPIPLSSDTVVRMTLRTTLVVDCAGLAVAADSGTMGGADSGTTRGADSGTTRGADSGATRGDSGTTRGADSGVASAIDSGATNNIDSGADAASSDARASSADGGDTRIVHSAINLHLCYDQFGANWASSGDACMVCDVVAEMAPSPIVPDKAADGLPLARALRLRIVTLARVSNTVVLLAENDGGAGLEYEWRHSGGRLERLAPDVVVWSVEQGMESPFIQAAVMGPDGAAVATFAWNDAA